MSRKKVCLASDNWSGTHPAIMQAIIDANDGYAPSYELDTWKNARSDLSLPGIRLSRM